MTDTRLGWQAALLRQGNGSLGGRETSCASSLRKLAEGGMMRMMILQDPGLHSSCQVVSSPGRCPLSWLTELTMDVEDPNFPWWGGRSRTSYGDS